MSEPQNSDYSPMIAALLAGMPKRRGRPPLVNLGSIDVRRAILVLWAFSEFPGQFETRREVIPLLQCFSKVARSQGLGLDSFPDRNIAELEQSVSRGMKQIEKKFPAIVGLAALVKKSARISHK